MGRKYFLTTFENDIWRALGPCPRTCSFSSRGLRTEQWGKQATAALGRPLPPPRKRNTPFWSSPGPNPPLVSHWLSVILPPLRDSANQNVLMGGAFSRGAESGFGLAPWKTATWLKEAGLFLN